MTQLRGAKRKTLQALKINYLQGFVYPVDYLFSNQFMEDLGRIYQLRKSFQSFDDENVYQSSIPSSDDSGS